MCDGDPRAVGAKLKVGTFVGTRKTGNSGLDLCPGNMQLGPKVRNAFELVSSEVQIWGPSDHTSSERNQVAPRESDLLRQSMDNLVKRHNYEIMSCPLQRALFY
jgi:hypothetical protein